MTQPTRPVMEVGPGTTRTGADPDTAIATWNEFVTCAAGVRSLKVDVAGQDMRARLHRLRADGIPGTDELEHRARHTWTPDNA